MTRRRPWTAEDEALLGTDTDARIAEKLGRPKATVKSRRRRLGIRPFGQRPERWTAEDESLFGRYCDADIARMTGRCLSSVAHKRLRLGVPFVPSRYRQAGRKRLDLPDSILARLGDAPDATLADEIGVDPVTIFNRRRERGIPAWRKTLESRRD